jgi:hypothetical protein
MLDELKNIKSGAKELREFGITIGAILIILGCVAAWRVKPSWPYLLTAGAVFALLGLAVPSVLKGPQKAWMALGVVLGFFVSRIVLAALFYGIITPIGLGMRLFGRDILDQRIEKGRSSYWHERVPAPKPNESYENQY